MSAKLSFTSAPTPARRPLDPLRIPRPRRPELPTVPEVTRRISMRDIERTLAEAALREMAEEAAVSAAEDDVDVEILPVSERALVPVIASDPVIQVPAPANLVEAPRPRRMEATIPPVREVGPFVPRLRSVVVAAVVVGLAAGVALGWSHLASATSAAIEVR